MMDTKPELAEVKAAFWSVLRSPAQLGKLALVAISLVVMLVVLPRFYWPDIPAFAQVIGGIAAAAGTAALFVVMAADAAPR